MVLVGNMSFSIPCQWLRTGQKTHDEKTAEPSDTPDCTEQQCALYCVPSVGRKKKLLNYVLKPNHS